MKEYCFSKYAYKPYREEALHCLIVDVILCLCMVALFAAINFGLSFLAFLIPAYLLLECFLNYRVALLSFLENRLGRYLQSEYEFESDEIEYSFSEKHGDSVLSKQKIMEKTIYKYVLLCKDKNGECVTLRMCMDYNKRKVLEDYVRNTQGKIHIAYGKYTGVIVEFFQPEGVMAAAKNNKEKEKIKREIDEELYRLNRFI